MDMNKPTIQDQPYVAATLIEQILKGYPKLFGNIQMNYKNGTLVNWNLTTGGIVKYEGDTGVQKAG